VTYSCGTGKEKKRKKQTKSESSVKAKDLISLVHSYSGLGVFTDTFLKEICFPLETDHFHPLKRVVTVVVLVTFKAE
jgi:hypothetical protein